RRHVPSIVGSQTGASAVPGFALIAEDGNVLPGVPRVQSEVFMAAGKTYDVMINAPAACTPAPCTTAALPIYDRELSLSANATSRDGGMLAYIGVNGGLPQAGAAVTAAANNDTYNALVSGQTLNVSDPAKGVIANGVGVYGVQVVPGSVTGGTLTLNTDGTFSFVATAGSGGFQYCANGTSTICATVTLGASNIADSGITCTDSTFTANTAKYLAVKTPGVLANCVDGANLP